PVPTVPCAHMRGPGLRLAGGEVGQPVVRRGRAHDVQHGDGGESHMADMRGSGGGEASLSTAATTSAVGTGAAPVDQAGSGGAGEQAEHGSASRSGGRLPSLWDRAERRVRSLAEDPGRLVEASVSVLAVL